MWLTAKNAPLWHFGYTHTEWGGMAHAVPVKIPYKIQKILQSYHLFIYLFVFISINKQSDILYNIF